MAFSSANTDSTVFPVLPLSVLSTTPSYTAAFNFICWNPSLHTFSHFVLFCLLPSLHCLFSSPTLSCPFLYPSPSSLLFLPQQAVWFLPNTTAGSRSPVIDHGLVSPAATTSPEPSSQRRGNVPGV